MNWGSYDRPSIVPLQKSHHRNKFRCGNPSLDLYLKKHARQDAKKKVTACFVLPNQDKEVMGYYTLSSTSILLNEAPPSLTKKLPRYPLVPAILLGRLAISEDYHGQGLGETLLMDALYRSWSTSDQIGSVAVVVDAIDDKAVMFYNRYGFILFPNQPQRLFIPMDTIAKLME